MKSFIINCFLIMAAFCPIKAEQNKLDIRDNLTKAVLICLQLKNNSLVTGRAVVTNIPFETSFTSLQLSLELVDSILFEENEPTAINLLSGERLKGKIKDTSLEIESLVGRLRVPIQALREINVIHPDKIPAELKEGLLFYYSFNKNESGRITDDSGNDRAGIIEGTAWIPDGFQWGARRFRGDPDNIRAPNSSAINTLTFTLSAWVTTTNMPVRTEAGIFGKKKQYNDRNSFRLFLSSPDKISFIICGKHHALSTITAGAEPIQNKWGLVTVTYDGTRARMFINDKLAGETDVAKYTGNEYDLLVGALELDANQGNARGSWFGDIDEARFYNRALSEKETQRLFFSDMLRYKAFPYETLRKVDGAPAKDAAQATVYLNDGSMLKGAPDLKKIILHMDDIGDITFPLPLLHSVCHAAEDRQVTSTLKNGDIFNGTTDLKAFDFSAVFGKVSVPLAKMSAITFGESELISLAGSASKSAAPTIIPLLIKPPANEKEINALIADLQSKDDSHREKTARQLVQIGRPALPALKKLLKETNTDARWWVEAIIQEIEK